MGNMSVKRVPNPALTLLSIHDVSDFLEDFREYPLDSFEGPRYQRSDVIKKRSSLRERRAVRVATGSRSWRQ